jgi:hypothetical protein
MATYNTRNDAARARGQPGLVAQVTTRTLALIVGVIGAVIGFVLTLLYSAFHTVGRIAGISNDHTHLFTGLLISLVAFIGALLTFITPTLGAVLLVLTTIGFFFIVGWWALLAAPFLLWSAFMAYRQRIL